jgi:hypothetical protein
VQHGGDRFQVVQTVSHPRRNFTLISDAAQDSINRTTFAPDKFGEAAPGLR